MAYTYDPMFAKDPNNPNVVASNATITIYDPADPTKTPIAITDTTGSPLPNPITVDGLGMGPAFQHPTLDRVAWTGGGRTNYFTSYEGMKNEAQAAKEAAQDAANAATTASAEVVTTATVDGSGNLVLTKASGGTVNAGSVKGPKGDTGAPGPNTVPTQAAIQAEVTTPGTPTQAALSATYASKGVETSKLDKTEAANTYAPATLGTKLSPILSTKLKGGNIAPKPGGYGWQGLFAEWDWNNWIKPQVDRAVALGLNSIRLIGGPRCIFVDPVAGLPKISQATYDAHWSQLADYCLRKGLYLYPMLVSFWDLIDVYGVGANFQDAAMTASIKTTAANLSNYSNVIAFDIFQEGAASTALAWKGSTAYSLNAYTNNGGNSYQVITAGTSAASGGPTGTGASITDGTVVWKYVNKALLPADVIAMMNAVRTVSNLPLTMSRSLSDGFGWNDTSSMWYQVFNTNGGADFIDLHIYLDNVLPGDPDFQLLKSGKPFIIGEYGAPQATISGGVTTAFTPAQQTARFNAVAALHNRRGIKGSFLWALADQKTSTNPEDQWGVWDNTGYAAPAFPGASTAPLSITAGKRSAMTDTLPRFTVADRIETAYVPPNLLSALQARPRNSNTTAGTGWVSGTNTYLYAEPRGLGFSAVAAGTSFVATSPATSVPLAAATYHRAQATILAGATARTMALNVDWYDAAGVYLSSSTAATGTDSTTAPLKLDLLVRSHTNAAYGVLIVKCTDAAQVANEAHIVIDASLAPVT